MTHKNITDFHSDDEEVSRFLQVLERSGLSRADEMSKVLKEYRERFLPTTKMPDGITALCSFLVCCQILTTWQCGKL